VACAAKAGLGTVSGAIALGSLLDHPAVRFRENAPTAQELAALLGLPSSMPPPTVPQMKDELKLEAPLAVQGQAGHWLLPVQQIQHRALDHVDASMETGINYRDYSAALGDLNIELRSFAGSSDAQKYPQVKKELETAMLRHREASGLWNLMFGRYGTKSLTPTAPIRQSLWNGTRMPRGSYRTAAPFSPMAR